MSSAYERVTAALTAAGSAQRHGGNWNCPGPGHLNGDRNPSLHVVADTTGVAMTCHAGCTTEEICAALGLKVSELFDEQAEPQREVARYRYRSANGRLLFWKTRYGPRKDFRVFHFNEHGEAVPGLGDAQRVLYHLPEIKIAITEGRTIWVVEGEKDADRLEGEGITATCNFDGASKENQKPKWRPEYAEMLAGAKEVIIVADRDAQGYAHARAVGESLVGRVPKITILQPAVDKPGADVSDHLDAGFTLADLLPLADQGAALIAQKYKVIDWHAAFGEEPEDITWLKEDFLEAGTLSCLFSKPGVGKSLISLEVALEVVRNGGTVMYIDDENRAADIVDRLRAFRVKPADIDRLLVYNFQNLPPLDTDEGGIHLDALAEVNMPDLVILDTISRMTRGPENEADTFIQLYRCSLTRLKRRRITVLRLDHTGKDSSKGQRGSSAKESDADVLWALNREGETTFSLECQKSRSGHIEHGTIIRLERQYEPLRHIWDVQIDMPLSRFEAVIRQMDILGISPSYGRDKVRKIFADNYIVGVRNDQLQAAIIERRNRLRRKPVPPSQHPDQGRDESGTDDCPF